MTYSIGEVAKMLNVSTQSLRSWERQGFIPECPRSPTNRRQYSDEGIKAIKDYLGGR
jgi:DNA-binding transcriptional MerR regulator